MILLHFYKVFEFWLLRKIGLIRFGHVGFKTIIKYGFYGDSQNIHIGDYCYIGENCNLWALGGIEIGNGTIIASNVIVRTSNHDYKTGDYLPFGPKNELKKVIIGKNCWIGANVLIAPGSEIGEGSIIGFGAVVSGKIPKCSIAVGNPLKIIKNRNIEEYNTLVKDNKIYYKYFDN